MADDNESNVKTRRFGKNISPQQVLVDAVPKVKGARALAVVFIGEDDYIRTAWSAGSMTELIGLLDIAKARIISCWGDEP